MIHQFRLSIYWMSKKNHIIVRRSRMLCPQSAALKILHFQEMSFIDILHHPTSPEACRKMNDKCITCSLVLVPAIPAWFTVQRYVQYSPSMSKLSECKLKGHQLLHDSSNTLPISPWMLPTLLWNISKKFTHVPQLNHIQPGSAIQSLDTCQEASLSGPNAIVDWIGQSWSFLQPNSPGETSDTPNSTE